MFRCVDATFPHGERKGIAASQPSSLLQNQYKYHFHLRAGWGGFVVRAPVVCIREYVIAAFFSLFFLHLSSLAGTPVFLQDHAETRLLAASSTANVTSVTAVTMARHPTYRPAKFVARALSLSLLSTTLYLLHLHSRGEVRWYTPAYPRCFRCARMPHALGHLLLPSNQESTRLYRRSVQDTFHWSGVVEKKIPCRKLCLLFLRPTNYILLP